MVRIKIVKIMIKCENNHKMEEKNHKMGIKKY